MICQRCLLRIDLLSVLRSSAIRCLSTTPVRASPPNPPAATSTSAAQPFSTPFSPSPSKTPGFPPKTSSKSQVPAVVSSVPAGTPLKGLGFTKGQDAPLAKEDSEYPEWLWGLLDTSSKSAENEGEVGDAFGESQSCPAFA